MTKIIIGQIEVEIKHGGRVIYDSELDTINIEPIQYIKRDSVPIIKSERIPKKVNQSNQLMIEHDTSNNPAHHILTKTALIDRVMSLLKSATQPTPAQFITMACLGRGATSNKIKYLKLLLDEMVEEGRLIQSIENNRKRFAIP